jgi:hypothetical protein
LKIKKEKNKMSSQWYGSIDNRIAEKTLQPVPVVGMGATEMLWSDRHAHTVLQVSEEMVEDQINVTDVGVITRTYPKWIMAKQDQAKVVKGSCQDGSAEYEFTNDGNIEQASRYYYHKPSHKYREESRTWKNGEIVGTKRTNAGMQGIILGYRDEYYDPCF